MVENQFSSVLRRLWSRQRGGAPQTARGRVLHVLKYYRPDFSGEAVFLERSSAVMHGLAHDVTHDLLVTTTLAPQVAPVTCSTIDRVRYLTHARSSTVRSELKLVLWMLWNVRRYRTVHFRTHADWYFLSYIVVRLARRRLVLSATLDDSVPALIDRYRPQLRPVARRLFCLFHDFITLNPKLHAETSAVVGSRRCHLLPVGVLLPPDETDTPRLRMAMRARLGIPQDALVLVSVGGLCARKDPAFLAEHMTAIQCQHSSCFLLLVGPALEPATVAGLQAQAAASGGHIRLIGEVADAGPWYDMADVMVFASHLEGFGTVVTEAMAHRLPIVARRLPEVNDSFVQHGVTGYAFTDANGFIGSVLSLARDPFLRRQMGESGRALVGERFNLTDIARRYLEIYGFKVGQPSIPLAAETTAGWDTLLQLGNATSLLDTRFHSPAHIDCGPAPVLITMVDAEEAFDWSSDFSRHRTDVQSMLWQAPAHRLFEQFGVVPIYAVDWPVASQDAGRAPLREWLADGRCDIGAQLHSWVTPPFEEEVSARNSFACNLPPRLQYEKLRRLTECIGEAFGVQPRVHRSGRYGIGARSGDMLSHLGYQLDSSVVPHWSFRHEAGPDFRRFEAHPYWADPERRLLEIPLTSAIVGRLNGTGRGRRMLGDGIFSRAGNRVGAASLAARTGMLERIKLTPEGMTIEEMKRLVRHLLSRGQRVFMMSYHTPSLQPGNTPYVRTAADADRFVARLEEFYTFFITEVGGRPVRWQTVYEAARRGLQKPAAKPAGEAQATAETAFTSTGHP